MKPKLPSVLILLSLSLGVTGCATSLSPVKPWEREAFTEYAMRPDRDPLETLFVEHINFSREAASGGRGIGGSGCGCN